MVAGFAAVTAPLGSLLVPTAPPAILPPVTASLAILPSVIAPSEMSSVASGSRLSISLLAICFDFFLVTALALMLACCATAVPARAAIRS